MNTYQFSEMFFFAFTFIVVVKNVYIGIYRVKSDNFVSL